MLIVVVTFGVILPAAAAQIEAALSVSAIVTASCALTVAAPGLRGEMPRVQNRCTHGQPITVRSGLDAGAPPLLAREAAQGIPLMVVTY
jgi:hypothetical protein